MMIRRATLADLDRLMPIFDEARRTIAELGIDQWQNGYPQRSVIENDIKRRESFLCELDENICGTFVMLLEGEKTYDKIYGGEWLTGDSQKYVAIHRVAIPVTYRGQGIAAKIIAYAEEYARKNGRSSLRIDTHEGNAVMRRMLEKNGFSYCGVIFLGSGDKRVAYEKTVIR